MPEPRYRCPKCGVVLERVRRAPVCACGAELLKIAAEQVETTIGTVQVIDALRVGRPFEVLRVRSPHGAVALKRVRTEHERDPSARARLAAERRVLGSVAVPGLIRRLGVTQDGRGIVLPLYRRCLEDTWPPPRDVPELALALAPAVHALHRTGCLHRDVHPGNVLLAPLDPREAPVVLADLGHAHYAGRVPLTPEDRVSGRPEFIAPERWLGEDASPASDVYSLGATLYWASTGLRPHQRLGSDRALLLDQEIDMICTKDPIPLSSPHPVARWVERALRRRPGERPSLAELVDGARRP